MARTSGRCSLHLGTTSLAPAFHLTRVTRSRAYTTYNSTRGNGSKVTCVHQVDVSQLKVDVSQLKVALPDVARFPGALLSIPVLANLVKPSVAEAVVLDRFPAASHLIQSLPLADLDPSVANLLIGVLGPIFASLNFLFIIRIVMSWYPQLPVDKLPYIIAFAPTEPVLEPTRKLIPPVGGVDVSPVIWVAVMSFLNEILLGQQGLLVLLSQQQG